MKRILCIILVLVCILCTACSANEKRSDNISPQISQMKSICELATMECYYHNVAKYMEDDATGTLWWKKDRKFWIEYAGIVTIGIDTSRVRIEIDGNTVSITIPPAKVLGCKVDNTTLTPQSFYVDKSSAPVEAEHQTEAYKQAQGKLLEAASNDTVLLANAQARAQKLLEDYINNIGSYIGVSYKIRWIYLDGGHKTSCSITFLHHDE